VQKGRPKTSPFLLTTTKEIDTLCFETGLVGQSLRCILGPNCQSRIKTSNVHELPQNMEVPHPLTFRHAASGIGLDSGAFYGRCQHLFQPCIGAGRALFVGVFGPFNPNRNPDKAMENLLPSAGRNYRSFG
jgi:hypothetical protein